ncbi:MAG TPA: LacI family DNA-binding transcriptional regulator, partial [Candidatus Methylacidiphilales bacterium]
MSNPSPRVSMASIAKACGVSKMTVSRVLMGKQYSASPAIKEKILRTAAKMKYEVNVLARQLKTNRTEYLGIATSFKGLIGSYYFQQVLLGIKEALSDSDYGLALIDSETKDALDAEKLYGVCRRRKVDGLLIVSPHLDDAFLAGLVDRRFPVATVGGDTREHVVASFGLDDDDAVRQALLYLKSLGHRRVGFLAGPADLSSAKIRRAAFVRHGKALGFETAKDWILNGAYTRQDGFEAALQLLSLSRLPTALVAANDLSALGAADACHRRGIAVPRQLSIVGIDDIAESALATPALTTVAQPMAE